MSIFQIFILGLIAGITVGAPWGPSGTYCFYKSLKSGWKVGFYTALGSVFAIFLFSFLAALLIDSLTSIIQKPQIVELVRAIMGLILLFIGGILIYSNLKTTNSQQDEIVKKGYFESFVSAFSLGIISGKNIIGFPTFLIAVQQTIGQETWGIFDAFIFGFGSLLSSGLLYAILIIVTVRFGKIVFARILPFLNYVLAILFIVFGLYLILKYLLYLFQ